MKYLAIMCFIAAFGVGVFTIAGVKQEAAGEQWIKVAIVDTGFNRDPKYKDLILCNLTTNTRDSIGHGTRITNLIFDSLSEVKKTKVCFIISQVNFKNELASDSDITDSIIKATTAGANIMNISLTTGNFTFGMYNAIKAASDSGILIFVAAGNQSMNLDLYCGVYPACFRGIKNMHVVGQTNKKDERVPNLWSNFGYHIDLWYDGYLGNLYGNSYSTARATADYVNNL